MKVSKRVVAALLIGAVMVSLVGATAYVWYFRITAPVVYGESLEFWYTDETLNGAWQRIGIDQTFARPAVDLTKGVFYVKVLVNNTALRPVGLRVEIKAVDTATGEATDFIGFNVTGVGFNWASIAWEETLPANSLTSLNIKYVLSSEAPVGYTGFQIAWSVGLFETVEEDKVEFVTVDTGYSSGHISPAYYVIQEAETWAGVWNQHVQFMLDPMPPPPIDFSEHTIIAVFMGEVSTGGYAIRVLDIVDAGSSIIVNVEKTEPGPGSVVTQALTQPFHMVQIAKTDKPVYFETVTKIIEYP